jgi:hypothetical protein
MQKKVLNHRKVKIAIEILLAIILVVVLGVKVYFDFFNEQDTQVVLEKKAIAKYGYKLEDRDTTLYEENYNELEKVLSEEEIDYDAYAELIAKLFIIDYYTLNNKLTSTDIGGLEFIHPDLFENFKINAGDTVYKYVENNLYSDRTQELPTVTSVTIIEKRNEKYTYNDIDYDSYVFDLSWEYDKDLEYQSNMTLTIIKVDNMLYVVKGQ